MVKKVIGMFAIAFAAIFIWTHVHLYGGIDVKVPWDGTASVSAGKQEAANDTTHHYGSLGDKPLTKEEVDWFNSQGCSAKSTYVHCPKGKDVKELFQQLQKKKGT